MTEIRVRRIVVGALETNCWAVHAAGDRRALLIDPGDEPESLLTAVDDLDIFAIVLTHQHWDHVLALPDVADALAVPVLSHPDEAAVWAHERATLARDGRFDAGTAPLPDERARPVRPLWDGTFDPIGASLTAGPLAVRVLHTPGHTPGGVCLVAGRHVFTGDTLFPGGPGLTGPPLSDFPTIMRSVRGLLDLPDDMIVHPGHGADTTVGQERPAFGEWWQRGW